MPRRKATTNRLRPTIIGPRTTSSSPSRPSKKWWTRPSASRPRRPPWCSRGIWIVPRRWPKSLAHPRSRSRPLAWAATPEPSGPLDIRRPEAAKVEEAKPPEALAMVRQKGDELPLPKADAPAPAAMPEARKEPPKTARAQRRRQPTDWAKWPSKIGHSANVPLRRRARWPGSKSSRANRCPRPTSSPGFPRRPRRKIPTPVGPRSGRPDYAARQHLGAIQSRRYPAALGRHPGCRPAGPISCRPPAVPRRVGWKPFRPSQWRSRILRGPRSVPRLPRAATRIPAADRRSFPRGGVRSTVAARPSHRSRATRVKTLPKSAPDRPGRTSAKVCLCPRRRPGGRSHRKRKTVAPAPRPARRPGCRGPNPSWIGFSRSRENRRELQVVRGRWWSLVPSRRICQFARCRPADRHPADRRQRRAARHLPQCRCCWPWGRRLAARQRHDRPRQRGQRPWVAARADRAASKERPTATTTATAAFKRARSEAFDLRPTATPAGPVAGTATLAHGPFPAARRKVPASRRLVSGDRAIGPSVGLGGIGRRDSLGQGIGSRPVQPDRAVGNRLVHRRHVAAAFGPWRPRRPRRRAVGSDPIRRGIGPRRHRPRQQPGRRQRPGS